MREKTKNLQESGVSEVIGFMIIIGIISAGIGLVVLYGYPALLDAQQNANIRNMERNMFSLQSDVNTLTYKSVNYKETTMQISGGTLSIENPDPTTRWFTVNNTSSPLLQNLSLFPANRFAPGGFEFLSDSNQVLISLQNGAVVKRQLDGSVMLSEPRWFVDERSGTKTLVINLIQIDTDPPGQKIAKNGIGTIKMEIEPLNIDKDNLFEIDLPAGDQITIEYHDDKFYYSKAWENYFINGLNMTKTGFSRGKLDDIDKVIIKAWKVKVLSL